MVRKEMEAIKRARILVRVSTEAQLDSNKDLNTQRQIDLDYIAEHSDWELDTYEPEYFEGSNSGYKNSVADRDILQEALRDAENKEYEILVVYKDDCLGRRIWEIYDYIMKLKKFGVDVYTVKDGCISSESSEDITREIVSAFRSENESWFRVFKNPQSIDSAR